MSFKDWLGRFVGKREPLDFPTAAIRDLYEGHGTPVAVRGGKIYPKNGGAPLQTRVLNERAVGESGALRLDVLVDLPDGRTIVECMAGWGDNRQAAIGQALTTFTMGVFHVLLKAFHEPNDPHMDVETWVMSGTARRVVVGDIVSRSSDGAAVPAEVNRLLIAFLDEIKAAPLPVGTHWVRIYCAQLNGKMVGIEVLLDNDTWGEMEAKFAALPWPEQDGFYSARQFTVIQDAQSGGIAK